MKTIIDPMQTWTFIDPVGSVKAAYVHKIPIEKPLYELLPKMPFTRVEYISQYGKANRTPRYTWCYGRYQAEAVTYTKRGYTLDFETEVMPDPLEALSRRCRKIAYDAWGFDPEYNSCIIGAYNDKEDSIGFHFDTEKFLKHHFCANVTLGYARDFQFRYQYTPEHPRYTFEIKLQHESLFFFEGLEHALPKRAAVKDGEIRYSISFRNMSKDVGLANSYYYCRGMSGAIQNENYFRYKEKLEKLQAEKSANAN